MKILFILALLISHCSAAVIKGIDLFGSDTLTVEQMVAAEPELFETLCTEIKAEDEAKVAQLSSLLNQKLIDRFSLPFVRLSAITYPKPDANIVYITFDVVEQKDAAKRLHFLDAPTAHFDDPDGLIASWDLYMTTAFDLLRAGEIDTRNVQCKAFHYIFGHQHPQLAPFEKIFIEGAAKHQNQLKEMFLTDQNEHQRAVAAFLLAYLPDGQQLVELLSQRIRDPSYEVRNNVMRVFAVIAGDHPEIVLPIDDIVQALDFPFTTDRNKAAAILFGLAANEKNHPKILNSSAILLKMIQLQQPNNSEWAYQILKKISQKDFPKEDVVAWENWILVKTSLNQ